MPPKADAYVVDDQDNPGEYLVRPGCAVIAGKPTGMKFRLRNLTQNRNVFVRLPQGLAAGNPGDKPAGIGKDDGADFDLNPVNGCFKYEVFVNAGKSKKAKGGSDPVIIIDPPTP